MRRLIFILLLLCSLYSPWQYSQESGGGDKLSAASVASSEVRTKKIQQELRHLKDPDWAGEYYFGDGLGVNVSLTLAPQNGFVFTWHGCLGLYDLNYGNVAFTNGTVKLLFIYPNLREGFQGIAPEFLPVHWGQRHYLIPVDGIVEFANAINSGMESGSLFGGRSAFFPLKRGDEKKPVEGLPDLPSEYQVYLLTEPIKARVTSILQSHVEHPGTDQYRRVTYIAVNVGSADRLRQGMELHVISPPNVTETATVESLDEHSATAVIKQWSTRDPMASTSWQLSTKFGSQ